MEDKIHHYTRFEDLLEEFKREDEWMKLHPYRAFFINTYRAIRRFILNVPDLPRDGYRKIKRGIQRAYRGWSDEDVWNLHAYNARVTYAMLLNLKKNKHGYPATPNPKTGEEDYDEARWDKILDQIIYAYKLNTDIANGYRETYSPYYPEDLKKEFNCLTQKEEMDRRIGMILFMDYFENLWD